MHHHPRSCSRSGAQTALLGAAIAASLVVAASAHADVAAAAEPIVDRAARFMGKFHVLVVHFPIALLAAGAFAEMLSAVAGWTSLRVGSRFFVMLGALAAVVAATLGWISAESASYTDSLAEVLTLHRWIGTGAAAWSVVIVGLMALSSGTESRRALLAYRVALFAGAGVVGLAAHLGGTLIHGRDYFTW